MTLKRRFKLEKLIRDEMPQIFEQKEVYLNYRLLEDVEHQSCLKAKLLEETLEVIEAQDSNELKEELADLLEVFYALTQACGFSSEEIETLRARKKALKGGFEKGVYAIFSEYSIDHPFIGEMLEKCQKNPEKYVEIDFTS